MITIDISTITTAIILEQTYTIPDNLKPFKMSQQQNMYEPIDVIPLKIKVSEVSAINVFNNLKHTTPIIEEKEDHFIYNFDVENSIELILRIIQCGSSVEILEPESFKKKFCKTLTEILAVYHISC
jgi:predicted DNA-binding transcriptional regulator YafY